MSAMPNLVIGQTAAPVAGRRGAFRSCAGRMLHGCLGLLALVLLAAQLGAADLAAGQTIAGEITDGSTPQQYAVTIDAESTYVVAVSGVQTNSSLWSLWYPYLAIYDADGNQIAYDSSSGPSQEPLAIVDLAPGSYSVEVGGNGNTGTYGIALHDYNDYQANLPVISVQPRSLAALDGTWVTFSVDAYSSTPLTYQWLRNGSVLWGATDSYYAEYASASYNDGASYQVVVTNDTGSVVSDTVTLRVQSIIPISVGQTLTGSIDLQGQVDTYQVWIQDPGNYQVVMDGYPDYGLYGPSLEVEDQYGNVIGTGFDNAVIQLWMPLDQGWYTIHASSEWMVYQGSYTLAIRAPDQPYINQQPVSVICDAGQQVSFTVVAGGAEPLSYQWLLNGEFIDGATDGTLILTADATMDGASIQVTVSNDYGALTSNSATLNVRSVRDLTLGAQLTDSLATVGETDAYRLVVGQAGGCELDVFSANRQAQFTLPDAYIELTNVNGTVMASAFEYYTGYPYYMAQLFVDLDPGIYYVHVRSSPYFYGAQTGTYAILAQTVAAPVITAQPTAQSVTEGQTATFSVTASSSAPLTYQWFRNGTAIPGAVGNQYVVTADIVLSGSVYQVTVSNLSGSVSSDAATLTVAMAPTLEVGQTIAASIDPARDIDLYHITITEAGGYAVDVAAAVTLYPYIQIKNASGNVVATGGGSTYASASAFASLSPGTYVVSVLSYYSYFYSYYYSSYYANLTGNYTVSLRRVMPPVITTQPISLALVEGAPANFNVVATSGAPLTYQWYRNDTVIPGATASTYAIANADTALSGSVYHATVSNVAGSVTSNDASLAVTTAPTLAVGQTIAASISPVGDIDWYHVTITAAGGYEVDVATAPPLYYPFIQILNASGSVVASSYGATSSASAFAALSPGTYVVAVRCSSSYPGDYTVTLRPVTSPVITAQPTSVTLVEGQQATFSVLATSSAPLSYQWSRNGVAIPRATGSSYSFTTASTALDGSTYQVVVSNVAGSVTSDAVSLHVTSAPTLAVGQSIDASLAMVGEVDWYHVTIAQAGGYEVDVSAPATLYPYIQILDAGGSVLANSTVTSTAASAFAALSPGAYIVAVRSYYSSYAGAYTVSLQQAAPPVITAQPTDCTITAGQLAAFTVDVNSPTPPSFQWRQNGTVVGGQATRAYAAFTTDTSLDGATYQVTVSNVAGSATSTTATLHVQPDPNLAIGQTIASGIGIAGDRRWYTVVIPTRSTVQVAVAGAGTDPGQWTLTDAFLTLSTSSGTTIASDDNSGPGNDSLLSATLDPGSYRVEVRGASAALTGTFAVSLITIQPPSIVTQPADASIVAGQSATFSVTATGAAPLTYQWTRNGTAISGATATSLTVVNADLTQDGSIYQVTVANPAGSVASVAAILHVSARTPQVITGFGPFGAHTFGDAAFAITGVTGGASGNPVVFATSDPSVASVSGTTVTIQGGGTVSITANQAGNALFAAAAPVTQTLTVARAAQSIAFADLGTKPYGTQPFTLSATASSGLAVALTVVSGPATLDGAALSLSAAGDVTIAATQAGNKDFLAAPPVQRVLTVTPSVPMITAQPVGGTATVGVPMILSVAVANPFGATYQWSRDGSAIPGADQPQYAVTMTDAGVAGFGVVVTNRYGSTASATATIRGVFAPVSIIIQPGDAAVPVGSTATFTVVAEGALPLTYQWRRSGADIAGATGASYTTPSLTAADDGATFQAIVGNALGPVASTVATLSVLTPPAIVTQPRDASVAAGDPATFTVVATGRGLSYQWQRNGAPIGGAVAATLLLPTVPADDGAAVTVVVRNAQGTATSLPATLHVTVLPPVITTQPVAQTIGVGETATLSVSVRSAVPVTYQWSRDGVAIDGATASFLAVTGDALGTSASYQVVATNAAGTATSDPVQVQVVNRPVVVTTQPVDAAVGIGGTAVFSVVAQGTAPLAYQWLRNGQAISGATAASLSLPAAALADDGAHIAVDVTNVVGTLRSATATLRVYGPPAVSVPPLDVTLYEGSSATLSVTVVSQAPVAYQWYRDGQAIAGATAASYTTAPVVIGDDGAAFTVTAANLGGTVTAGPAHLRVQARLPQVITGFGAFAPHAVGDPDISLMGVTGGGSGNPVTFTSSDGSVAVAMGSSIRITGAGTARITADQPGNTLYAPAVPVSRDITITRGSQTIAFAELRSQPFGTAPFAVTAQASSRLPVALSIVSGPGVLTDGLLRITGIGTVVITASQAGNADYLPAADVTRSCEIQAVAPIIVQQPSGVAAPIGASCTLHVVVSNGESATYQWFGNGAAIPGATTASFAAVAPGEGSAVTYHVAVSNLAGTTVSSDAVVQGIFMHPSITTEPRSLAVYPGESPTFSVVAQGSGSLAYQWFRDGTAVAGATGATCTLPAATLADDGARITVTVSNQAGTAASDTAILRVNAVPRFVQQPADLRVDVDQPAVLTAVVDSALPLTYQWMRNDIPVVGATTATYRIEVAAAGDDGSVFRLIARNALGMTTSDPATLTVTIVPPVFTLQPVSVVIGAIGDPLAFTAAVRSSLPVTYQWFRDGIALDGATTAGYARASSDADVGAVFTVVASNAMGSTTSANATVSRVAKPVILGQPNDTTVFAGEPVGFGVVAQSFDPARVLSYQWQCNGIDIPGATASSYRIESAAMDQDGNRYAVLVSDGPASRLSQAALLHVKPARVVVPSDPARVYGDPVDTVVDPGDSAHFSVGADGTPPFTFQWYRNGQAIPGANEASYATPPVLDADYGTAFHVTISNAFGTATSVDAHIAPGPVIVTKSTDPDLRFVQVMAGDQATYRVVVRGQRPIAFRWYRNGAEVADATADTYVIPPATPADDGARLSVTAWSAAGTDSTGMPALSVFSSPPAIDGPQDPSVPRGADAVFAVGVSTHPRAPATFQWYRDDVAIAGQTQPTFVLGGVSDADLAARFRVMVSNRFGSVTSRQASVTLRTPLAITAQPRSVTVMVGEAASFTVAVNDPSGMQCIWRRNGVPIFGSGSGSTHTTPATTLDDNGAVYDVLVQGAGGQQVVSDAVTLTVVDNPPAITVQPQDAHATIGQNAIFSVAATGSQPLQYQWYRDGVLIGDQSASTLSVPTFSLADDGARFTVVVSNQRGRATSTTALLTVTLVPATVITDPDVIAEIHGDSVLIHPRAVVSNGDTAIYYRWTQISGQPVTGLTSGWSTSARLELGGLKPGDYDLRCAATYPDWSPSLIGTSHDFRFRVTLPLLWITPPRLVGDLSPGLAGRIEAVAGFEGVEDPTTTYHWSQVDGPAGAVFAANDAPGAKASQVQLPGHGRFTLGCAATWRGTAISRQVVIDTDATDTTGNLASLSGHTLLVAATAFDAGQWASKADYRDTYIAGVEPGRVWQSAEPGGGLALLRADSLRLHATAGATVTLRVHGAAGAPVSWAALHGGTFANNLNAVTVAATADGEADIAYHVPQRAGSYAILVASPLAVGRLVVTVVVP